jgi:hypothetical protein
LYLCWCPAPSPLPPCNVNYTFNSSSISTTFCAHSSKVYQNKNHRNDNIVLPFSLPHTSCHHLNIPHFNMVELISKSCKPSTTHPHHSCVSPNWNSHQTSLPMMKKHVANQKKMLKMKNNNKAHSPNIMLQKRCNTKTHNPKIMLERKFKLNFCQ